MKDEKGDLIADSHNILIGGKLLLLTVHRISDINRYIQPSY
jgi:hypothetical protein